MNTSSREIRETFLSYFEKQGHQRVSSSSLIPENDATLLFANAGMNQFKNLFLGLETKNYTRAASSQKCVRAGGKHNDLENVGFTARHHTFFEMLGNFSFGDYFKKDAIHFAWELLTKEYQIPKNKLYVTVFKDDDEAAEIWHHQEGVPKERIFRFAEKANFCDMGDVGPCGPCSEIFYDHGPTAGRESDPFKGISAGEDRFVEIWNLVFMQFEEKSPGVLVPLPKPSVDTGSGLERVTAALQGKKNNYDTDLFWNLIQHSAQKSKNEKLLDLIHTRDREGLGFSMSADDAKKVAALRVLADHTRAVSFLLADGVLPSNEGRGYVLRRILRRAVRFFHVLDEAEPFLPELSAILINSMKNVYPELESRKNHVLSMIEEEQRRFVQTLKTGLQLLEGEIQKTLKGPQSQKSLSGEVAFRLYDSSGFPLDLTQLIASEHGLAVDLDGFEKNMEQAKDKARASWKGKALSGHQAFLVKWINDLKNSKTPATEFVGYTTLSTESQILSISDGQAVTNQLNENQEGYLISTKTPFYAEGGGQVADRGVVSSTTGEGEIFDVQKKEDFYIHSLRVRTGTLKVNQVAQWSVNKKLREACQQNHSATHLLHAALRKVLGDHVTQAGSLVEPKRLRFDFTHPQALKKEELQTLETIVNAEISNHRSTSQEVMSPSQAAASGAMALFGEKYGDKVRVLSFGSFSKELCGGTHVHNTSEIRVFKITSESGVSAGVRRIEAVTGDSALTVLNESHRELLEAKSFLNISKDSPLLTTLETLQGKIKSFEKELKNQKSNSFDRDSLLKSEEKLPSLRGEVRVITTQIPETDRETMAQTADFLRDKLQPLSAIVLVAESGAVVVSVSKDLASVKPAGNILKVLCEVAGGKGGGRPQFAQGAIENSGRLADGFSAVKKFLAE